jgi:hypothetical protein
VVVPPTAVAAEPQTGAGAYAGLVAVVPWGCCCYDAVGSGAVEQRNCEVGNSGVDGGGDVGCCGDVQLNARSHPRV